ncbi:MAG TPA: hypothetical protein VLS85_13600 [Hanamia sp.]|nr:hypothetical protein [Hanamia sp.]
MRASIYIGIFFIALIIITDFGITWFSYYKKKKEKQKQLQKFNDFVIKNNLTIDSKQRFNKNIIGIDRLNYAVVFLNSKIKKIHVIQLKELTDCRLIKQRNKTSGHISQIFLQCIFKQKEKDDVILPFYNEMNDDIYMLIRITKRAAYWTKRVNIFREAAALKGVHRLSA